MSKEFEIYLDYATRMKNLLANLKDVLLSIKKDIVERVPNAKIYLFGSIARGRYTAASDVDILVVVDDLQGVDIYKLKTLIKMKYPGYPIELHIIDTETLEKWYTKFIEKGELVEA